MNTKKPVGPLIISGTVLLVLLFGAIYFWVREQKLIDDAQRTSNEASLQSTDTDLSELQHELQKIDIN